MGSYTFKKSVHDSVLLVPVLICGSEKWEMLVRGVEMSSIKCARGVTWRDMGVRRKCGVKVDGLGWFGHLELMNKTLTKRVYMGDVEGRRHSRPSEMDKDRVREYMEEGSIRWS